MNKKEREEGLHEQQQKELIRLLKWIQKNSAMWEEICNPSGMEYSAEAFYEAYETLVKDHFWYLIPVLFTVNRGVRNIKLTMQLLCVDGLVRELQEEGTKKLKTRMEQLLVKKQKNETDNGRLEEL